MDMKRIDEALQQTYEDFRLSKSEKTALREVLSDYHYDNEILNYARNQAFSLVGELSRRSSENYLESLKWLEHVVKTIDTVRELKPAYQQSAYFSPGEQCVGKIRSLIDSARATIDVCVFTISDDRISETLVKAHEKGRQVRIISDNDKSADRGSDIEYFVEKGLKIKVDTSPNHMHHKFAIFDNTILLNGSFNWTRSASRYNHENIMVSTDIQLVNKYSDEYKEIWKKCVLVS